MAGIAAGNGRASGGRYKGVAPEASLIVVKLRTISRTSLTKTTEIMRAMKYIIELAELYNMPVAINLSYGTNEGAHDGSSLFDTYIDDMSRRWKTVICVATGNEGSAGHHKSGTLREGQTEEIDFVVSGGHNSITLEIWKLYTNKFDVEIISPGGESTGRISFRAINQHFQIGSVTLYIEFTDATPFSENECVFLALFPVNMQLTSGIWTVRKENDPYLCGQKLRACLKFGAKKDRGITYPNSEWGYGKLCLVDSFRYLT